MTSKCGIWDGFDLPNARDDSLTTACRDLTTSEALEALPVAERMLRSGELRMRTATEPGSFVLYLVQPASDAELLLTSSGLLQLVDWLNGSGTG